MTIFYVQAVIMFRCTPKCPTLNQQTPSQIITKLH